METTANSVTPREQALIDALRAIVNEAGDYPKAPPVSFDSYLPVEFLDAAQEALARYEVQS